jgi:sortase A
MKRPRNLRRSLGSLSIAAGLLLIAVYLVPTVYGTVMSHLALAQFRAAGHSNRLWDSARIRAYERSLAVSFPAPEAILRVPKAAIEVPILEGTDDLTLNRGVGHIPGTALPGNSGNIAITGHRDGFFRGLKDITAGDTIEVMRRTKEGQAHTDKYLVRNIKIVLPSDTSVLNQTDDSTLTLITCYPFYYVGSAPQRYIVQASLIAPNSNDNQSSAILAPGE